MFTNLSINSRGEDIFNFPKSNTQTENKKIRSTFRKITDKILSNFDYKETEYQKAAQDFKNSIGKSWKQFCKDFYIKNSEIIATNTRTNCKELNNLAKILTKYDTK